MGEAKNSFICLIKVGLGILFRDDLSLNTLP